MISRRYIACKTCGHTHIARIQIGHGTRQDHSFPCSNCKELIRIALDLDQENARIVFHLIDNCVNVSESEGTFVYLSPDFLANEKHINEEMTFPSFEFMAELDSSPDGYKFLRPIHKQKLSSIRESWEPIKKSWRLIDSGQYQLADPLIRQFANEHGLPQNTLRENLWYFVNGIFPVSKDMGTELDSVIKLNPREFERFSHFYQQNLRNSHRRSQFEILSEYFDTYSQHSQVLIYLRMNAPPKQSAKATSIDFDKVKAFYAKGYEFFAGSLCILTCLNNIKEGRPFDQLKHMTLTKYLDTDKAKRRDSIAANKVFYLAASEFDSKVRNASYHNWFFMRPDNSTIEYRSGGTGAIETITYTEYLYRCGLMFKQICQLFSLELVLDQMANEIAFSKIRV